MEEMKLIGSRNLGIHNENSDWDYAILDLKEGGTFRHIVNEKIGLKQHCYHYNKEYRYKVARFESYFFINSSHLMNLIGNLYSMLKTI